MELSTKFSKKSWSFALENVGCSLQARAPTLLDFVGPEFQENIDHQKHRPNSIKNGSKQVVSSSWRPVTLYPFFLAIKMRAPTNYTKHSRLGPKSQRVVELVIGNEKKTGASMLICTASLTGAGIWPNDILRTFFQGALTLKCLFQWSSWVGSYLLYWLFVNASVFV